MKESELFSRGIPASIDAERSILGGIMLDNEIFFEGIADLKSDDFALDSHQRIFFVMNDIFSGEVEGIRHVDIVTLAEELAKRKWVESIGGVSYLASLTEGLPRRLSVEEYVHTVKDKAKLRRMINIFSAAITRAADQGENAEKIRENVESQLLKEAADETGSAVPIGEVAPIVEAQINARRNMGADRLALDMTWGVSGMDGLTKGAFGGELTVAGGDSGGGKTAFAVQMVLMNAREGTPCGFFSLEMSKEKLVQRFYPAMGEIITTSHMRDPRLINLHTHVPEMARLRQELSRLPIWIDETSALSLTKLRARIRMMRRKHGIKLFVVDYLQLVDNPAKTEPEQIKGIVFGLRDLVKAEPSIHILLLSQYSKADGFSKKKRRTKSDLMGSSAIHHAAHNILLITIESPDEKERTDLLDVECRFDKQREGRVGKENCYFDRDHLRFMYPVPAMKF